MKQRVITAVVLLAILALVVWQINTPVLFIAVALLSAIASNEIMKCAKIDNKFILVTGTIVAGATPFFVNNNPLYPWIDLSSMKNPVFWINHCVPTIAFVIIVVLAYLLAMLKGYSHTSFENVAVAVFASIVIPFDFSLLIKSRDVLGESSQFGIYVIFYALICALATDTGAQLGGMAFGKTKMSPNISPKKTVEGAVCGVFFSMILNSVAVVLFNHFADYTLSMLEAGVFLACVPVVSFMGMMGDLSASVLKRNFGVKDFGKIFPGHGGVMDRMDSTLFTLPLAYIIAKVLLNIESIGLLNL